MKLTFLGTSAGEEFPGIWCECDCCTRARELGGKNIRRNSCVMFGGDAMIDMGKTAHMQAERFGLNMRGIKTLLVTHSHKDHLDLHTMWARQMGRGCDTMTPDERKTTASPRFSKAPVLDLYGSDQVEACLKSELDLDACGVNFIKVSPYENHTARGMEIFTLDGNHPDGDGRSINFIVKRDGVTFLYLTDTGWPFDKTLEEIAKCKYNFVIAEGTFGLGMDSQYHMNLDKSVRLLDFFNTNGLWKNEPDYYLTHICPHWSPPYDDYLPIVEATGFKLAYDGMEIEYS